MTEGHAVLKENFKHLHWSCADMGHLRANLGKATFAGCWLNRLESTVILKLQVLWKCTQVLHFFHREQRFHWFRTEVTSGRYYQQWWPHLLVEFGVWRALVNEQFDDMFIALPRSQVERVAALIVGDVGQGLVPEQRLHHLAVKHSAAGQNHTNKYMAFNRQSINNFLFPEGQMHARTEL